MDIGYVISDSNTKDFSFVIEGEVKVGDYVETEEGVLGRVGEITIKSEHLSDELALSLGEELFNHYPIKDGLVRIAQVDIIGRYDGEYERTLVPPEPGSKVRKASMEKIKELLEVLPGEHTIHVGNLRGYKEDVYLNVEKLIGKHLSILAMSGAGKSNFVSVMVDELMQRGNEFPIVILDIHGEYAGLEKKYPTRVIKYTDKDIKLSFDEIESAIVRDLYNITEQLELYLDIVIERLREQGRLTLENLMEEVSQIKKGQVAKGLLWRLRKLQRQGIFQERAYPALEDIQPGNLILVDFSEVYNPRKLSILGYVLLKRLFDARRRGRIPPLIVVVEEAHNLAPERTEARLSRQMLERIAREGRKFGVFLVVVSQRPAYLSQTLLAQMNVQVTLRITNPHDLQYISQSSEHISSTALKEIPSLLPGEAILTGYARFPLYIKTKRRDRIIEEVKNKSPYEMLEEWQNLPY
ncbi:MAG: ATP-binding protein [Candidatus Micrarchaeota archaeon]|nr:ATP-binding protein [Candidatus Micrarchaeota archaeon]